MSVEIKKGWNDSHKQSLAILYEEAFGQKFQRAISSKEKRVSVLAQCFVPSYSFVALINDRPVGIAGFSDGKGSLTGGMGADGLIKELGLIRGLWSCVVFSLFERKPADGELVMDGIVVDGNARGQGVGSMLLDQIVRYADEEGYSSVRLDVIDSNPRAKKLYESKGFVESQTDSFPYLQWLIGFSGSTTMIKTL